MMEAAGIIFFLSLTGMCMVSGSGSVNTTTYFRFSPKSGIRLTFDETQTVETTVKTSLTTLTYISLTIRDGTVAKIAGNSSVLLLPIDCAVFNGTDKDTGAVLSAEHCFNFSFKVQGVFLGRSDVQFYAGVIPQRNNVLPIVFDVAVLKPYDVVRDIFTYCLMAVVALNTIGFGCALDLSEMLTIIKKPVAPAIGLGCQYILNPLIAYGLGKAFGISLPLALGLFSVGCSPGGGGSNMWTYLLDGDLNLSILMTFISTIVCFGMLPLWMYTLGKTLTPENVTIPFANIFISLAALVVPCIIGILIKRFSPKVAMFIRKLIKPVALVVVLLSVSMGMYSNLYMFTLLSEWRVLLCGFLAPYSAYIFSASISWTARQPPARILTISIETAIQNTPIAVVLILTTFPQPEADIAAVMPVATVMFTPFPLIIMIIVKTIRKRCCKSDSIGDSSLTSEETSVTASYKKRSSSTMSDTKQPRTDDKDAIDKASFDEVIDISGKPSRVSSDRT